MLLVIYTRSLVVMVSVTHYCCPVYRFFLLVPPLIRSPAGTVSRQAITTYSCVDGGDLEACGWPSSELLIPTSLSKIRHQQSTMSPVTVRNPMRF